MVLKQTSPNRIAFGRGEARWGRGKKLERARTTPPSDGAPHGKHFRVPRFDFRLRLHPRRSASAQTGSRSISRSTRPVRDQAVPGRPGRSSRAAARNAARNHLLAANHRTDEWGNVDHHPLPLTNVHPESPPELSHRPSVRTAPLILLCPAQTATTTMAESNPFARRAGGLAACTPWGELTQVEIRPRQSPLCPNTTPASDSPLHPLLTDGNGGPHRRAEKGTGTFCRTALGCFAQKVLSPFPPFWYNRRPPGLVGAFSRIRPRGRAY